MPFRDAFDSRLAKVQSTLSRMLCVLESMDGRLAHLANLPGQKRKPRKASTKRPSVDVSESEKNWYMSLVWVWRRLSEKYGMPETRLTDTMRDGAIWARRKTGGDESPLNQLDAIERAIDGWSQEYRAKLQFGALFLKNKDTGLYRIESLIASGKTRDTQRDKFRGKV